MDWRDEGIILGTRKHGETSAIVELMTRGHGRHLGLVQGGRSHKLRPLLQAGNRVAAEWRARLDEHLGQFVLEPVSFAAARLIESRLALSGLQLLASHLRLLPERDPHPQLFETLAVILGLFRRSAAFRRAHRAFRTEAPRRAGLRPRPRRMRRHGPARRVDLCLAKVGQGGLPRGRHCPMPTACCRFPASSAKIPDAAPAWKSWNAAWKLCGFFLARDVYGPRGIEPPDARSAFIAAIRKLAAPLAAAG